MLLNAEVGSSMGRGLGDSYQKADNRWLRDDRWLVSTVIQKCEMVHFTSRNSTFNRSPVEAEQK